MNSDCLLSLHQSQGSSISLAEPMSMWLCTGCRGRGKGEQLMMFIPHGMGSKNGILPCVERGVAVVSYIHYVTCEYLVFKHVCEVHIMHKSMEWLQSTFVIGPSLGQWLDWGIGDDGRGKSPRVTLRFQFIPSAATEEGMFEDAFTSHPSTFLTLLFCKMFIS